MESLLPHPPHIIQLPSRGARITPPPDEMSPISPKNTSFPLATEFPETISTSSQSEGGSTPCSSTRRRHRKGTSASNSRPTVDCKPPPRNASLVFSPRPYESLYTERAYLTTSLQKQTAKAAELMRHFSSVEALLDCPETGKERRRLRKQLNLLRSKINEAVDQEKTIFNRLGELYVELQSRENWAQASLTRSVSWDSYSMSAPSGYSAMSPLSCSMPTPTTPLNAMSPVFTPVSYFSAWQPSETQQYQNEDVEGQTGLETVHEAGEEPLGSLDMPFEYRDSEEVEVDDCQMRRMSCDACVMPMQERRLSLPCLQTSWPED